MVRAMICHVDAFLHFKHKIQSLTWHSNLYIFEKVTSTYDDRHTDYQFSKEAYFSTNNIEFNYLIYPSRLRVRPKNFPFILTDKT